MNMLDANPADRPTIGVALAIFVSLLASFAQSFGLTLTRKSHVENDSKPESGKRKEWKRPLWIIGSLIFILSNSLGSVFQLSALPIVILAPLGGVSLCWNALFAKFILGDSFSRYLILGTLLIGAGAVLIAVFGTVDEPTHTLDELIALYNRPAFIAWFSVLTFAVLATLVTAHLLEWSILHNKAQRTAMCGSTLGRSDNQIPDTNIRLRRRWSETPIEEEEESVKFHLGEERVESPKDARTMEDQLGSLADRAAAERKTVFIGIAYGGASGTLSGLCLLFAKTGTELLLLTIIGQNQFNRWQSWLIVLILAAAGLAQLWYLNRALRMLGPTLVCPLAFCFYNLSSILNGLVYYDQWRLLSPLQAVFMSIGIAVLFVGVWIVSLKTTDDAAKDDLDHSERTPLMDEPIDGTGFDDSSDEDDEMGGRQTRGLAAMTRMFTEARPRGFSIGLGASSPGFAIRPQDSARFRKKRNYSTTGLPSSSSHTDLFPRSGTQDSTNSSEPPVSPLAPHPESSNQLMRRSLRRSLTGSLYVGANAHGRSASLDHLISSSGDLSSPHTTIAPQTSPNTSTSLRQD